MAVKLFGILSILGSRQAGIRALEAAGCFNAAAKYIWYLACTKVGSARRKDNNVVYEKLYLYLNRRIFLSGNTTSTQSETHTATNAAVVAVSKGKKVGSKRRPDQVIPGNELTHAASYSI